MGHWPETLIRHGDTLVSGDNPLPVTYDITQSTDGWVVALNNERIDDLVAHNSAELGIANASGMWVHIKIVSQLTPTTVRIIPQFSHDANTWCDFEEGLWASLMWEDTDTAALGVWKAFLLPIGGQDIVRFQVIGVGTDGNNYFDVTIITRTFTGAYSVAHA